MDKSKLKGLAGNDLFAALQSKVKEKKEKKKATVARLKWHDEKLMFLIHEVCCTGCGKSYQYPNNAVFIRRVRKDGSIHYMELNSNVGDPEVRFRDLELVKEYRRSEVSACQFCCDIAHIVERARRGDDPHTQEIKEEIPDVVTPQPTHDPMPSVFDILEQLGSKPLLGESDDQS